MAVCRSEHYPEQWMMEWGSTLDCWVYTSPWDEADASKGAEWCSQYYCEPTLYHLKDHGDRGKVPENEKKAKLTLIFKKGRKECPGINTWQPHLGTWEDDGVANAGSGCQTYERQGGDWDQPTWIYITGGSSWQNWLPFAVRWLALWPKGELCMLFTLALIKPLIWSPIVF